MGKHEDNEYGDVIKGRDWYAVEGYVRGLGRKLWGSEAIGRDQAAWRQDAVFYGDGRFDRRRSSNMVSGLAAGQG